MIIMKSQWLTDVTDTLDHTSTPLRRTQYTTHRFLLPLPRSRPALRWCTQSVQSTCDHRLPEWVEGRLPYPAVSANTCWRFSSAPRHWSPWWCRPRWCRTVSSGQCTTRRCESGWPRYSSTGAECSAGTRTTWSVDRRSRWSEWSVGRLGPSRCWSLKHRTLIRWSEWSVGRLGPSRCWSLKTQSTNKMVWVVSVYRSK